MDIDNMLDWSDNLEFIGEPSDYLFRSQTGYIEFVIVEEEMTQLNDYCVLCLIQTSKHLAQLEDERAQLERGECSLVDPDFGDFTHLRIDGLTVVDIPRWEDSYSFFSRATCLLLLHIFTEKSLKSLCDAFRPQGEKPARQKKKNGMCF